MCPELQPREKGTERARSQHDDHDDTCTVARSCDQWEGDKTAFFFFFFHPPADGEK